MNTEEIDYSTRDNKLAVFTAWLDGKEVEYRYTRNGSPTDIWATATTPQWDFTNKAYRVKTTPKRVPLEAKDVPPGSALDSGRGLDCWNGIKSVTQNGLWTVEGTWWSFEEIAKTNRKIKRPGEDWKDCSKEVA